MDRASGPAELAVVLKRLTEISPSVLADINNLTPQLKPAWDPITTENLVALLASPTRMYVALDGQSVVGMVVLVPHRHLPGLRFHIEDVVIDESYRRRGIARALLEAAMADVPDEVISFDLRSHGSREGAHELYLGLGFEPSGTTVFRRTTSSAEADPSSS